MASRNPDSRENSRIGLCARCVHMREIRSDRGTVFYQCGLSATDARFPKYPRLPVVACEGYQIKTAEDAEKTCP